MFIEDLISFNKSISERQKQILQRASQELIIPKPLRIFYTKDIFSILKNLKQKIRAKTKVIYSINNNMKNQDCQEWFQDYFFYKFYSGNFISKNDKDNQSQRSLKIAECSKKEDYQSAYLYQKLEPALPLRFYKSSNNNNNMEEQRTNLIQDLSPNNQNTISTNPRPQNKEIITKDLKKPKIKKEKKKFVKKPKKLSKNRINKKIKKKVEEKAKEFIRKRFEKKIKKRINIMIKRIIKKRIWDINFYKKFPMTYVNMLNEEKSLRAKNKKDKNKKVIRKKPYSVDHTFNLNGWGVMNDSCNIMRLDSLKTSVENLKLESKIQSLNSRTVQVRDMFEFFEKFIFSEKEVLEIFTRNNHGFSSYALLSEVFEVFDHKYKFLMSKVFFSTFT